MASLVYLLGAFVSLCCGVLLLRSYRHVGQRLLLWSGLCFVGLAVSNLLIFVDLVIFPDITSIRCASARPRSPCCFCCTG